MIKFTDNVGTKMMSFIIGEGELYTSYCVIVETVEGSKITVIDTESPSGVMCADTRKEAIKKGKDFLKRMKERE